ncbi:MAG TPA: protein kinase [Myxococcota bacterium]|nr:protein kinase [Myxococcota bacterium]
MSSPVPSPEASDHPFVSRYQDLGSFAQGGFAIIHDVREENLRRRIAMKVLKEGIRDRPATRERFLREARITAQLDHPCIVPIHELGAYWFTMKRIDGLTFRNFCKKNMYGQDAFQASLAISVGVLVKVCDTLAFAHDRGILHCDLKPENLMIGTFGQVYLMDWGIARPIGERDATGAGTPGWMPPEQARLEACDERTDVYGVGGLLYHALCGGRPHEGSTAEERLTLARAGVVRPPEEVAPDRKLPPELVRIAMKAMEPNPANRYPTMLALQAELNAAVRNGWWFATRHFPRGYSLIREGDTGNCAYILVEGTCEVFRDGHLVGRVEAGEVVGEAALLNHSLRTATVRCTSDVVVRVITPEAMEEELSRSDWMGTLVRSLARRFEEAIRP